MRPAEFAMFKWCCLGLAALIVAVLGWMVNDLRQELKRSTQSLNERLPEILDNVKQGSESLRKVSEDLKQLRNLAGVSEKSRDQTLSVYYDSLLDFIQASAGQIGKKKLFGRSLSDAEPAEQWVVGARQEAVFRTMITRTKSRQDVLDHLCNSWRGSDWYIQLAGQEPQKLIDWLRANHPETRDVEPQPKPAAEPVPEPSAATLRRKLR